MGNRFYSCDLRASPNFSHRLKGKEFEYDVAAFVFPRVLLGW